MYSERYKDYLDDLAHRQNYVNEQMKEQRKKTLQRFQKFMTEHAEELCHIFAVAYLYDGESALKLAKKLNFKEKDFNSIVGNEKDFEKNLDEEEINEEMSYFSSN